jgi:hypothetical protein
MSRRHMAMSVDLELFLSIQRDSDPLDAPNIRRVDFGGGYRVLSRVVSGLCPLAW